MKIEVAVSRLLHRAEETMLCLHVPSETASVSTLRLGRQWCEKKEVNTQIDSVFSVFKTFCKYFY